MTLLPASATYPSVFITNLTADDTLYNYIFVPLVLFLLSGAMVMGNIIDPPETPEDKKAFRLCSILSVASIIAVFVLINIATSQEPEHMRLRQEQVAHMNTALQQKYHATLTSPEAKGYTSFDDLANGTYKFNLSFPDGKTGVYSIKWNKDTSEPTIIDNTPPSVQDLNQNANKH